MGDRKTVVLVTLAICGTALMLFAVYVAASFYLASHWMDKEKLLDLKPGMTKQEVISALVKLGAQDVLPIPKVDITVKKANIDKIEELKNISGVCVRSYSDGTNLNVAFDEKGGVTKIVYGSVKKFPELSDVNTRDELIRQLRPLMERSRGLEAYACVPDVSWLRITNAAEADTLRRYDFWMFDEPNSYSGVRLRFENDHLSKIEYRYQRSEWP